MVATLRLIEYDSITVSYAWELTSVLMCYSQGDGLNTSLFKTLYWYCTYGHLVVVSVYKCLRGGVSGVYGYVRWYGQCATQEDVHKNDVCTLTTSLEINRPPHLRPSRIYPELWNYETRLALKDYFLEPETPRESVYCCNLKNTMERQD